LDDGPGPRPGEPGTVGLEGRATGLALAAGIVYGVAEPVGAPAAGVVNALAYTLWALWLPPFVLAARRVKA